MSETSELGSGLSCEVKQCDVQCLVLPGWWQTPAADRIELDSGLFSNSFSLKEASVLFYQQVVARP